MSVFTYTPYTDEMRRAAIISDMVGTCSRDNAMWRYVDIVTRAFDSHDLETVWNAFHALTDRWFVLTAIDRRILLSLISCLKEDKAQLGQVAAAAKELYESEHQS